MASINQTEEVKMAGHVKRYVDTATCGLLAVRVPILCRVNFSSRTSVRARKRWSSYFSKCHSKTQNRGTVAV
jgi:hypothetical protein